MMKEWNRDMPFKEHVVDVRLIKFNSRVLPQLHCISILKMNNKKKRK